MTSINLVAGRETRIVPWGDSDQLSVTSAELPQAIFLELVRHKWCRVIHRRGCAITALVPRARIEDVVGICGGVK